MALATYPETDVMLSLKSNRRRLMRAAFIALPLAASVAVFLAITPRASAQTDVPDAPTAVAVYSIESQKLEVRWSTSDATSTTSFKIQWKSGSEEFDSSRQLTSDPATSIQNEQTTAAGKRYKERLTGLTDGAEYTVRVIATNANGDSDPSAETTGTPQSTPGQAQELFENEVVEIFESSHPWLRDTWDYITSQNVSVIFHPQIRDYVELASCTVESDSSLLKCGVVSVNVGRITPIKSMTHELAHVYTLANGVTAAPGPLAVAHLYFSSLTTPFGLGDPFCGFIELYADVLMMILTLDVAPGATGYWRQCRITVDGEWVTDQALAVVRSAAAGEMPSWFADTYNDSDGDPDLERVWADVKSIPTGHYRAIVVYQLRDSFGGYCDNQKARESAFRGGVTRNPWSDGGCVPEAPANVAATAVGAGKLTVSWQEPPDDGGSPIEGYKLQWKSGTQEYGSSRQVVVTDLSDLRRTISGLTNDESHTLHVLAYNHNGDGAATEVTATPTATDTTAPVLLLTRFDSRSVRLIWNEALDDSSRPDASAFTVNVNGTSRRIYEVAVLGNAVWLSVAGTITTTDELTASYVAPTGSGATPLKDSAGNNAPPLPLEWSATTGLRSLSRIRDRTRPSL